MGPVTPSSVDGFRYFVTFIDEYSSHECGKFMRTKNEVYRKFKDYLADYVTPCILRSDNGTEYTNRKFVKLCTNSKIKSEYTTETRVQIGVVERYTRTVVETARSLWIESKLPKSFWLRAAHTAAYVRNLVKKDKNQKSPYENFWGINSKINHLKVFGCLAFVKNQNHQASKFDPKSRKHVFLGSDSHSTACLLRRAWRDQSTSFQNETRNVEDDCLFDVSCDEENLEPDNYNIDKTEIKEENLFEPLVTAENEESEDSSSSDELRTTLIAQGELP